MLPYFSVVFDLKSVFKGSLKVFFCENYSLIVFGTLSDSKKRIGVLSFVKAA